MQPCATTNDAGRCNAHNKQLYIANMRVCVRIYKIEVEKKPHMCVCVCGCANLREATKLQKKNYLNEARF